MAAPCQPCGTGLRRCHLRRIGSRASLSDVADVIHFWKTVTLIGRNRDVVDYFLSCGTPRQSGYISRIHARVIRTSTYELVDSSLTGVYVNDVRICGRVSLQEGDTVTFGHPDWQRVTLGDWARQPNSPFYFLFEHCHCSLDQVQRPPGEVPVLAAAEASPEVSVGLGSEKKVALPQGARAIPGLLPTCPALPDQNVHRGGCCPAAFSALTLPLSSAASVQPPVASLSSTGSVDSSSSSLDVPSDPRPGALPDSARGGSVRSASKLRRSLSPEYAVLEEEMPGATEPSSQGALETRCGSLIQEGPVLICSDPTSGSKELPAGGTPPESCSSEAGTCPLRAACCDRTPSSRPASACLDDSVAADLSHGQCGSQVSPAELLRDVPQSACSFQTEQGDSPESALSPPGTKEWASGGSDPHQETMEMEIDESTEGTAKSDPAGLSGLGAPEQVPEGLEEAVSGGQVTSAGCSGDPVPGEDGAVEGDGEILTEKPFPEAGLQEAEWAAAERVTGNSLTNSADPLVPETLALLSGNSGSRTPGALLCGQEPAGVLPASLGTATEVDPKAPSTAGPQEAQGGRDACEANAQASASEEEGGVEMSPLRDTRMFAAGGPLGPHDAGSVEDPEVEGGAADDASVAELSFAEAGTQTGGTEEREETGPGMAEAGEEREASGVLALLQLHDPGIDTHVAKETLLQPSSAASASGFPAREVHSQGEFSREGTVAAASSGAMQENSSSEDLTETCKGETLQADAAPPAGLVLGEGTVLAEPLEADLREQPMDLDGSCSGECLSQGSGTCSEGDQEGVAAGRELERGRSRGTEPDPTAEGQLAACRLGDEEGRCEGDGVPPSPACASPAASPGGKEPDSLCDESKGQEEVGHDGASGGGELGAQRGGSVVASAFPAAVGEGRLENQPEGLLGQPSVGLQGSCGSAGGALARSPEGDVACSSAALARDHAVPPAQLPSDALGEGEGIPPVEDSCVGTQLLIQRSEKGAGGRLESEESRLLPKQDGTEEEQEAGLSNEVQVTSQSCSVGTKPLENAQQPHEMAEPKQKSSQVERWTDRLEGHGMSSAPPTQLGCQADSPLPPDCQGPGWDAGEPQGPEPQGTSAGKGSLPPGGLPVEGSTWEEACQADAAAECSTPPGPEGRSEGVVVPAQGDASQQSPEGSSSGEEMGKVSLGLCAAGPGRSGALRESPATSLPRLDSVVVPESSSSDELNLRISDSEAEREENDDSQAHGASGREAVDLEEKDALISASAEEHLDGAPEDSEVGSKQTEWRATQGQGEAANPETGGGLSRAADALAPQTSFCYEACGNLSHAALAVPETSITDTAAGGRSPAFVKAAAAREEPEAPAGEGTELMPLNLSCVPEEDPCLLESEDQGQEGADQGQEGEDQGVEDQAPGSISGTTEEVGSDLPEDDGRLESRFARQPGGETLEVGEAPEGRLQGEIPAGVCAEKADCNPKRKERAAPLRLQQEMGTWQPQGSSSPSEDDPGCRKWLESPERGRIPFPKEEESGDCSSRKRHFSQDQAPGMVDSGHDSSCRKRLCLLDSGSGLPPSTSLPSAPLDRERHRDQFSRTIGRFLQQYSSQVTLPSDETEEKNRDSIAQIVRSYFHSTFGPAEPEAEDLEAETSALPLEGRVSGDGDWKTAAGSEAERSPAGEETESSLTLSAEPQVPPVPCQDPSLRRECPSPGSPSCSSISCSQQPGQEPLAHRSPETAWDAYFSEEEEFQSSISSVLEHSLLSSPVASPEARCGQEPCRKSAGLVFSDISNSWAESEHCGPPPEPGRGSSRGMEWGQLHGMQLPEAAAVDLASGDSRRSPGPAGVGWCKEETSPPSGMPVSSHEHPPIPEAASPVEPGDHLDAAGGNTGTPVLQQAGGTFDGEGDRAAPGKEASDWVTSGASCPLGEAGEELDDGASRMQTEDGVFLQKGLEDSPPHDLECKPAIRQPPDSALWDPRAPSVKAEPGHVGELADEDGSASPSRTALVTVTSASAGCPTAADPRGGDSVLQGSSASRLTFPPGQTRACSQAQSSSSLNASCLLRAVKQDGGAETADADAGRKLPSEEEGSSLCPLPPFGPAGIADGPEERGFGGGLERDLGRSGAKWPGQTDTSGAPQGDAGGTGRSAGPSLTVGAGGSRVPACSPWVQEDAPVLIRMPSLSSSRLIKEEPDPCDSHVPVAGSIPCGGYPTARSPVIPVLQKPGIPEASANWVPESPEGCATEEWRLDEDEAPGQLDTASTQSGDEHAPCMEAEEGRSSALAVSPRVSEPPLQRSPWACEGRSAQEDASASSAVGADSSPRRPWASSEQEIAFQLQECQSVLEEISRSLCAVEGIDHLHMEKWREQIAELQKATKPPSTYIAVVGNTGAGKSSLLNALLDEEAVLPTSAMRACTAVVVEVSRGAGGRPYEAEVEFLSQEEWYKELTALLEDMKDKSGNLKKRYPDRKTEAGAAYSRVKAVYGMVGELAKLKSMQDVTQHLGTVKRISAETAADFRAQIEKFIDSRTDSLRDMKGGEFWPIVKCVKIRVGRAEALKTGVVLVDLPGIRDSNAARDNAAKEYLKNCNAVWVVASITRAVDDKTAREILNSNLRRQLFMDGLYGNLAFICTKTDSFNISDIVRDLDLRGEIQPLEEELEELEGQRMQAEEEKRTLHMALHLEQRPGVEAADPAWLQKEFQLSALQKQKEAKLRAISLICVQARNKFSKQQIRMDFNTGLEELKRKAEFSECDEDGDEDMGDGDFASSDLGDFGEDESQREKLHVFTVSSTEYLKLSRKLLRDGPAQVFHDPKDTEIPALKDFVIEMGLKTSMKATEKVIRDVARVISQIVHYLTNQRAEDVSHQAQVQEKVQQALQGLPRLLQEATDDVLPDIQYFFEVLIQTSLSRGSNKAKGLCEDIVKSWGLPGSGFPHSTYHAACLRHGVYTSLKCGCVDFNLQLAKPVNDAIAGAWFAIFGSKMEESLERFTKAVLDKLKCFFRELKSDVGRQGSLTEALDALRLQQMEAIQARLRNFLLDQEAYISKKQRSISRMLTPAIQAGMEPAYTACSQMSGPGYFQRMKDMMERYVRENKDFIFEAAAKKLEEQLNRLQQRIRGSFQSLVLELNKALRMQFEPLLQPVQKKAEIIPDLMNICAKVDKICKRSCVAYALPSASQEEAGSPEPVPLCLSALHLDVRLGALPLPCIAAIQVSGRQDLALRLADESALALPLGSVSLCESCLPLGCLILHLSAESAGEICRRCRVRASSPGQHGREVLVILDKAPDQALFSRLVASVLSSRRDASWVQTLSLCQGRERLESLGVYRTPRQAACEAEPLPPQVVSVMQQPLVNLLPYGRKRAGEAGPAPLEKRHKSQAGADHAGHPLPSWSPEGQAGPCGGRAASCPLPARGGCFPEDCRRKTAASEPLARPGSAGAPVRAEEGFRGRGCDPDPKGDRGKKTLKALPPVETGKEAFPAVGSRLFQ